jgi:hypothetical protein
MKALVLGFSLLFLSLRLLAQGPVVFVDGNGAEQEAARLTKFAHTDDQTMEMTRDLLKSCPEISITRKEDASPNYFLLLNRGPEYGLFRNAVTQIMLLDGEKNVLYSSKQGTVAKAVKDGCKAILSDWKSRRAQASRPPTPEWNIDKK